MEINLGVCSAALMQVKIGEELGFTCALGLSNEARWGREEQVKRGLHLANK